MTQETNHSSILRPLLGAASLVLILAGVKVASSLVSPILLALIIAVTVSPVMGWMKKKGLPEWLTMLLTIVLIIGVLVGLVVFVGASLNQLIDTLPQYEGSLQGQKEDLQASLQGAGIDADGNGLLGQIDPDAITGFFGDLFGSVVNVLSGVVLMLVVLIFVLLATPHFPAKLKMDFAADSPTLARARQLVQDLRDYVGITTLINFGVAVVNVILLLILGVDFALLWGVLSFLLGYIPAVGFWLALIPPFFLALAQFGPSTALIVLFGYVVINGGIQNFVQPKVMGDGVNLSPLIVTLSLVFWTWILGPMGALLAVPLTMIVRDMVLAAYDDTRALVKLMSAAPHSPKPAPDTSGGSADGHKTPAS